jgi:autotransporter translocation and assembly factor TamB
VKLLASLRLGRLEPLVRHVGRGVAIVVAVLVAVAIGSLSMDLGPAARQLAERYASNELGRSVRIGTLRINLLMGTLFGQVEALDVRIAGRRESDRPFFTAGRVAAAIDWWPAVARRPNITVTAVDLTDWNMLVEKWDDGTNFPRRRSREPRPREGKGAATATLRDFRGTRGVFAYEDHEAPWSVVAPNISVSISNYPDYHGTIGSTGGRVSIQDFVPMWANIKARFAIDGSTLRLDAIDLESDGARSSATGHIDMARWPEQTYTVSSRVHFHRMRELFFAHQPWPLSGEGDFNGTFHLFKGGHDLSGSFSSPLAGFHAYRFPNLYGSLQWTNRFFEVTNAGSDLFGGDATFEFSVKRTEPDAPKTIRFDASYADVDLAELSDFQELPGLRFAGQASGRNVVEWPSGKPEMRKGDGHVEVRAPEGAQLMTGSLPVRGSVDAPQGLRRFSTHVPVAGEVSYQFDTQNVTLDEGQFATPATHVAFAGRTAWADETDIRFRATSRDWQESQQVLAGILTDFGSPAGPVAIGGRGQFTGQLTGQLRRPRVEGAFTGEDMRAWDTLWGDGSAQLVVENNYVTVKDGTIRHDGSEIQATGLFSLRYPRGDGGQEIDARFRVLRRDVDTLRHAFKIDDYPVSGVMSGEFHLTGQYARPFGFGSMTIEPGTAYGESFDQGRATLRFDGAGIRLDAITVAKGAGTMSGAAFVGWDATYSFDAEAREIPMEAVAAFAYPTLRPGGAVDFTADGSGTFDAPRYDVRFRVSDLSVAGEPVGQATGTLAVRGSELTGGIDVASPRLAVTGSGRIALTQQGDAELSFRFHDSSLDPYVRLFEPRLSPYTTAVASGSIRVKGQLADVDELLVEGTVDRFDLQMFDYAIRNAGPVRLALDRHVVRVDQLELVGQDTRLRIDGTIGLHDQRIALQAIGDANLGILQGFFRNVRGSGRAELAASVNGDLRDPVFSGSATISNGRVRHFSLPNALDGINGTLRFDSRAVRLDEVTAIVGGGRVQFGGRAAFEGYLPGELNVTMRGEGMQLRYPEGVRSTVDADLLVRGNVKAPTVGGSILVKHALWNRRLDPGTGLLDLGGKDPAPAASAAAPPAVPLRLDIQVLVPSTLRIDNNMAKLVAGADLQLRGTYDRPLLFGRADVDRGEVLFEGRRYLVTKGAIEFTNPSRIEPFFDVEAQTRVRVPGQTYQVTIRATGTMERLQPTLESDPPLPAGDVLALLFSDVRRTGSQGLADADLRALQQPNERETDLLTTAATRTLTSPISSEVGRVVEKTFGVDTFQLTPTLVDPYSQSTSLRVNPSARVTIGKRVSDRVYLTFSRSLSTSINDQILLLEYDESDRFSWILSRNEDQTYAIEVRVRHTF